MSSDLFDLSGLTPHGFCLSWRPELFWSMATADAIIALSYLSISVAIIVFLHRRKIMHMRWVGGLFAAFIMLCALSHIIDAWTLWFPDYGIQVVEKIATALISAFTAILLWPLIPRALEIPSAAELEGRVALRTQELLDKTALLSQSNADLEQFAYVASHDLQTPLRNIVRYSQLLERRYEGHLDSDANDFIGFIVESGKHMSSMIQDLLDYARVTSQSKPLEPVPSEEAVAQALFNLQHELDRTGAEVVIGELPKVMAEPARLVSLLQNLMTNAIKYGHPDRPPKLLVSAERIASDRWRFAVTDNGIGIEPQYFDKIFEIFQRLQAGNSADGTGIGLPLCRRIVNRFGGTIWVESEPGLGTTFYFTLCDASVGATTV